LRLGGATAVARSAASATRTCASSGSGRTEEPREAKVAVSSAARPRVVQRLFIVALKSACRAIIMGPIIDEIRPASREIGMDWRAGIQPRMTRIVSRGESVSSVSSAVETPGSRFYSVAMFRPCIDLHEGKVKQIVGGSLAEGDGLRTNYVSDQPAAWYAELYRRDGLSGGHIVMLGSGNENEA